MWLDLLGALPFADTVDVEHGGPVAALLPPGAAHRASAPSLAGGRLEVFAAEGLAVLAHVNGTRSQLRVAAGSWAACERARDAVAAAAVAPPESEATVRVTFWHSAGGFPRPQPQVVPAQPWGELARNYPAAIRGELRWLHELATPHGSGRLVLWYGEPGTGKSTAIRSLASAWRGWCRTHVVLDPDRLFADTDYLVKVLVEPDARPWRLLVAEDTDELLRADAGRGAGGGLARLLNLTDGLVGSTTQTLVLLTTNEDVGRLHPAVTRPGRCLAQLEFPRFEPTAAAEWLGEPAGSVAAGGLTLAELFERRGDIQRHGARPSEAGPTGQYL